MIENILIVFLLIGLVYIGARAIYMITRWKERIRLAHLRSESNNTSYSEEYEKLKSEIDNMPPFSNKLFGYYILLSIPMVLILTLIK